MSTDREVGREYAVNRTGNVLIYIGTIMMCLGFPAKLSDNTALGLGVGGVFVLLLGIYMSLGKGARQTVRSKVSKAGGAVGGAVGGAAAGVGRRFNQAVTSGFERLATSQPQSVPQKNVGELPQTTLTNLRSGGVAGVAPDLLTAQNVGAAMNPMHSAPLLQPQNPAAQGYARIQGTF